MSANSFEIWRVMTPEGIFETDLETLKQWIVEGCVLPTDKVAKGNLGWIDAGRAPLLRQAFASEISPPQLPSPPQVETVASVAQPAYAHEGAHAFNHPPEALAPSVFPEHAPASPQHAPYQPHAAYQQHTPFPPQEVCYKHQGLPPNFICRACGTMLCHQCPKYVGNQVPLCPLCGDLCKPFQEVRAQAVRHHYQTAGLGFAEFGQSLIFPFRNIFSVLAMSILYAILLFGGFKGRLVACGLLFGCMSHVINQFAWGRTDCGLFPAFDGFSWWDNVIRPMFVSMGIYIITFGPMFILAIAIWFGAVSLATTRKPVPIQPQPEQAETTQKDIDSLLQNSNRSVNAQQRPQTLQEIEETSTAPQLANAPGHKKEREDADSPYSFAMVLGLSVTAICLILLSALWALFYYPMALAVAGYTEDFWSVINPAVGIDTMRRMGWTYVKAFLMYLPVQIAGLILTGIVYIILAPFDVPFFGNLPASFVSGIITFYTSLIIACILGFALFKCADKLGINTD